MRFVFVPGLADSGESIENAAKTCESFSDAVGYIDMLGSHQLGCPEWHELRISYLLEGQKGPNAVTCERVISQFRDYGPIVC